MADVRATNDAGASAADPNPAQAPAGAVAAPEGAIEFVAADRSYKGELRGWHVDIDEDVGTELRDMVSATLQLFGERARQPYTLDLRLADNQYLAFPRPGAGQSNETLEVLSAATLDTLDAEKLGKRNLVFWGVRVGDDPDNRVAFVRKENPRRGLQRGRRFFVLGNTLSRITGPVIGLADHFQIVVTQTEILALDQRPFEQLFRDTAELQAQVPTMVQALAAQFPIAGDGAALLEASCQGQWNMRRRLVGIMERGHLAGKTMTDVRDALKRLKIPEAEILDGDELRFDPERPWRLLKFLNEDMTRGVFSDVLFDIEGKSAT